MEGVRRDRLELQAQAQRVTDAIAATGHSPALLSKLTELEARIAAAGLRMEACKPRDFTATPAEIRKFIFGKLFHIQGLLRDSDASRAKGVVARHIGQLVLKSKDTASGPIYEVSGKVDLQVEKDVMVMVARDGIGTPTDIEST
jgi:hypothetical protein